VTRARDFFLASLLVAYPDDEAVDSLRSVADQLREHQGAGPLLASLAHDGADELRSRYIDLFDRGKERTSLYETEYGRMGGVGKGNSLADIQGFYLAFGLQPGDLGEAMDHAAVELEFYAILLLKEALLAEQRDAEGLAIVADARKKFLADHLGRFLGAIAERPGVQQDPCYGPAFAWGAFLVAEECSSAGVSPAPLDFFADPSSEGEVKCGGFQLPVLPSLSPGAAPRVRCPPLAPRRPFLDRSGVGLAARCWSDLTLPALALLRGPPVEPRQRSETASRLGFLAQAWAAGLNPGCPRAEASRFPRRCATEPSDAPDPSCLAPLDGLLARCLREEGRSADSGG
jgi:nitrate reductase assembly molybdenum cofactor insertion protein NarJ